MRITEGAAACASAKAVLVAGRKGMDGSVIPNHEIQRKLWLILDCGRTPGALEVENSDIRTWQRLQGLSSPMPRPKTSKILSKDPVEKLPKV